MFKDLFCTSGIQSGCAAMHYIVSEYIFLVRISSQWKLSFRSGKNLTFDPTLPQKYGQSYFLVKKFQPTMSHFLFIFSHITGIANHSQTGR
jgi:hypothetical protein